MFDVREKPQKVERALLVGVYFDRREEAEAKSLLEEQGIEVSKSEPIYQIKDSVTLTAEDQTKLDTFLEKLHEVDDVDEVFVGI